MTDIVLIPVSFENAMKGVNAIKGKEFKSYNELNETLKPILNDSDNEDEVRIIGISEFVNLVNEQELDNLSEYYIAHVHIF
jgi:hypothetical protein